MAETTASDIELGKQFVVLYVEDSDSVRETTKELLEIFFDRVDAACDGVEGLEKYLAYHKEHGAFYDIVITDIKMPKMDGIEMIKAVHEHYPLQPIIVVSAHNEAEYLLNLINLGISYYILKPIELEQFKSTIGRLLRSIDDKRRLAQQQKALMALNRDLLKAKNDLETTSKHKSRFLANMSHEIRTPLNAVAGFISLLTQKESDPEKLRFLNVISTASESLLQIINDILDISKIESGKLSLERADFDPVKDLMPVIELFGGKADEKHIIFSTLVQEDIPPSLHGDALRIKQMLSNLLSNAVKFTPKEQEITCAIRYDDGLLRLSVEDTGIGISEEEQKSVFDPFTQAEHSPGQFGGTGLGLAIVAELCKLMGGTLSLQSTPGKGSRFELSLPLAPGTASSEASKADFDAETAHLEGTKVLLAEDNEANRLFIEIVLQNAGIDCAFAANGAEAVERFENERFDLILMDENMPKMNGREATKAILRIEAERGLGHTPIIALTANALKGDRERFLAVGMDDYLSKPVEPATLVKTIGRYVTGIKE